MKKQIFSAGFILCCLMPLAAVNAEIVAVTGKAEIKQNGVWIAARQGNFVKTGDTISTAFKSELTLKIDGSVIVVRPLTRLTIEEIATKNETVSSKVYLNTGAVKADVKPASTEKVEFKVTTPVATASVRGTSGIIDSDGTLEGFSGQWLYVNAAGETLFITPGNTVSINDNGTLLSPHDAKIIYADKVAPVTLAQRERNALSVASIYNPPEDFNLPEQDVTVYIGVSWED